jgi:hypothetical protein
MALAASVALTVLLAGIASISCFSAVGVVLLPGALLAALVFPQGIDSANGGFFIPIAGLLDSMLFAFPVMWIWSLILRHRSHIGTKEQSS